MANELMAKANELLLVTLVEEVDGLHAGVLFIADLQLVELTEQIDQLLHHLHAILAKPARTHTHRALKSIVHHFTFFKKNICCVGFSVTFQLDRN